MRRLWFGFALAGFVSQAWADFSLTIIHTNDLHGHLEPTTIRGKSLGGYARMAAEINRVRATATNPIVLNAGDTFQGTLYFGLFLGQADAMILNQMNYQAACLGNHEFDKGPVPLARYASRSQFPLLACNLDFSAEPTLRDRVKPWTVVQTGGAKIGLVGAVTPDVFNISSPGPTVKLLDLKRTLRSSVASLREQGVDKIVLLSHLGYALEQEVAREVEGIDVIVGGHSHSLLGAEAPGLPKPAGPYPTEVESPERHKVLLLSSWEWCKVVGSIQVEFDDSGYVKSYSKASPTVMDDSKPEEPVVKSMVSIYGTLVEAYKGEVLTTAVDAIVKTSPTGVESTMGNLIADSMLDQFSAQGAQIAMVNSGGIRSSWDKGPVTYSKAYEVMPFANTIVLLDLTGAELLAALEEGIPAPGKNGAQLQVSRGFAYVHDRSKPEGQRVTATLEGKPIDPKATYTVVVQAFIAAGGDNQSVLKAAKGKRIDTGIVDLESFVAYLKKHPTLDPKIEGRVTLK